MHLLLAALSLTPMAQADTCDRLVQVASSQKGDALVATYSQLVRCDRDLAAASFGTFAKQAGDLETLVPLSLAAIDGDAWNGVWEVMTRIPFSVRGDLAEAVGESCHEHAKVVPFIQGAYAGLKGTSFAAWEPALTACGTDDMGGFLEAAVRRPPSSPYNEKYNTVLTAFAASRKAEALPTLKLAAIAAADTGPFNNVLDTMQRAVQPDDFAQGVSEADTAAMEQTMVEVAEAVSPDQARIVADRLYTAGSEARAASLLPSLYPARVQDGGTMMWAAAAIEACDDGAVVHWTTWTEAPTRIDLVDAAAGPLRASKAKLKCDAGEWPVFVSPEPLKDADDATGWLNDFVTDEEANGRKVKVVLEKKAVIR